MLVNDGLLVSRRETDYISSEGRCDAIDGQQKREER
jgi:hypothetical protein